MMQGFWQTISAAIVSLCLAGPALAQQNMPPPGPPPGYNAAPPTPADQSDRLRRALNLRPDQETALQSFVAAMQPRPGEVDRLRAEAQRDALLPTPQRLDAMLARMDSMRGEVVARISATRTFYAGLTPAQQRVFDQMPSPGH